ncbi:MAG TPA: alkaline phosphatase family protein [Gammaproteobacteria bacterium]|nr:alkaline phosphatase family protein [Gammaproteobacteria bacterium]
MPRTKLLVIGLDAAEPALLRAWAGDGSLPHLARLLDSAACSEMLAPPGQYAGAIWPTIHTGCSPARHGRYLHTQLKTGTYTYAPFLPPDIKAPPFWERLSRAGKRVAVIDVPKAPVVEPCNGVQLLDWGAHDPEYAHVRSSPSSLAQEIEARFGADPVGVCDRVVRADPGLAGLRDKLLERIRTKKDIVRHVLADGPWDLVMAVFADSHCAGHQFWHMHDPQHPKHDAAAARVMGDPLKDVYRALDDAIGELIASADADTGVIVFTSHGMGAHYDGTFLLRDILRRLQARAGRRNGAHVAALRWLWGKLPEAARKWSIGTLSPMKRNFDIAEMRDRDFFAVPTNDNCGGIRINLKGREPGGRVSPGADYDRLCAALASDLGEIVNQDTGEPLVRAVVRTDSLFEGPHVRDLPDLNVVWNRETPVRRIQSPKIGVIERRYEGNRTGDHRSKGLFIMRGAGIPGGKQPPISAMDLAPTICRWLGVELDADGSPRVPSVAMADT